MNMPCQNTIKWQFNLNLREAQTSTLYKRNNDLNKNRIVSNLSSYHTIACKPFETKHIIDAKRFWHDSTFWHYTFTIPRNGKLDLPFHGMVRFFFLVPAFGKSSINFIQSYTLHVTKIAVTRHNQFIYLFTFARN